MQHESFCAGSLSRNILGTLLCELGKSLVHGVDRYGHGKQVIDVSFGKVEDGHCNFSEMTDSRGVQARSIGRHTK